MTELLDDSFFWVRGFGYHPGTAPTGLEIWGDIEVDEVRAQLTGAREHFPEATAIRLWLSFDAWMRSPARFAASFDAVIDIMGHLDLRVMPCLFNNWHSIPDYGGISPEMVTYWNSPRREVNHFLRYLDDLVGPHATDERIFAWDLCNEPFNNGSPDVFLPWLKGLRERAGELGAVAPITVGVGPGQMEMVEPLCDVLSPHLYRDSPTRNEYVAYANRVGKPMFAGETGWGSLDEDTRLRTLHGELAALVERRVGFLIHILGHSLVADCHRRQFGPVSEVGFMGCIEADGSLRPGYESIRKYFA